MHNLSNEGGARKAVKSFTRVEKLVSLLGNDVLLLPWPKGTKGSKKKWKHLTAAAMDDTAYLRELETANIGVAQGVVSNGLCSIDFDDDESAELFLAVNPALSETLMTRGARGCNIWVRCIGEYPRSAKLKTVAGKSVGEWRATGNQTIISGTHPSGCEYRFLYEAAPVDTLFAAIAWPDGVRPPGAKPSRLGIAREPIGHSNTVTQQHSELRILKSVWVRVRYLMYCPSCRSGEARATACSLQWLAA